MSATARWCLGLVDLDEIINTHNCDGSLRGEPQRLDLAHSGLQHTALHVVHDLASYEVQAVEPHVFLLCYTLCCVVERAQLGNQVRGVLSCVD